MRIKTAMKLTALMCVMSVSSTIFATTINFDAIALRGANPYDGLTPQPSGKLPDVSELAKGNGATGTTEFAGQKFYYGTNFFDGITTFGQLYSISFSYDPKFQSPYTNVVINSGTSYAVIASQNNSGSAKDGRATFLFGNGYNYNIYEKVNTTLGNGNIWNDIQAWTIVARGLDNVSSGELNTFNQPKGPVDHGLVIIWGDSQRNYLGEKVIWDIEVQAYDKTGALITYNAGNVPEPTTMMLLGLGLVGLVGGKRKFLG